MGLLCAAALVMVRKRRTRLRAWSVLALLAAGAGAGLAAADPTSDLGAGGLAYAGHPALITDTEDVTIAAGRVRATYVVRNGSDEARTTLIAFALPDIDMLALDGAAVVNPAYDAQNPTNFVGFSALVDGQPAETYVESRALALGLIDVTARLRDLNLPLYPLNQDLVERLAALPETSKADLLAYGLIRMTDGQPEPLWHLKTTLFWQQPFAAGQSHTLTIAYRPIAGSSAWTAETGAALQQRFCVPDAVAAELDQRAQSASGPATVTWVTYLASAGAGGRSTVGSYRLALETAPGTASAFTCRVGLTLQGRGGSRETVNADHVADDEVLVLFAE